VVGQPGQRGQRKLRGGGEGQGRGAAARRGHTPPADGVQVGKRPATALALACAAAGRVGIDTVHGVGRGGADHHQVPGGPGCLWIRAHHDCGVERVGHTIERYAAHGAARGGDLCQMRRWQRLGVEGLVGLPRGQPRPSPCVAGAMAVSKRIDVCSMARSWWFSLKFHRRRPRSPLSIKHLRWISGLVF
jgi:hypothetical protein